MGDNIGRITQVMGPVVDVEFGQGNLPSIYTALTITNPAISDEPDNLVVEVAQHLGEGSGSQRYRQADYDAGGRSRPRSGSQCGRQAG